MPRASRNTVPKLLCPRRSWAALGAPAHAAHPLLTEDTGTQGLGKDQLELMVDEMRDHGAGASVRERVTSAVLSYGIRDDVDLQFGLPHVRQHMHDAAGRHAGEGVLDTSADIKWRFFERETLSLGLKTGVTLPTGDKDRGFGTGRVTWGALLIGSYEPGRWASIRTSATAATTMRWISAPRCGISPGRSPTGPPGT